MTGDLAWIKSVLPVLVVGLAYLCILATVEGLRRHARLSGETTRKLAHVAGGLIGLSLPILVSSPWQAVGMAVTFLSFFVVTRRLRRLPAIHDVPRPSFGAELYPLGIASAFLLSNGNSVAYAIAVLALSLGDTTAAVAGRLWGRHRFAVLGTDRSLEGSAAALAVTLVASLIVLWIAGPVGPPDVLIAIRAALGAAAAEALSPLGTDNLVIPAVVVIAVAVHPAVWAAACVIAVLPLLAARWRGRELRTKVEARVA
jgi:phytol kinase